MPQAPQLLSSEVRFTQSRLQLVNPVAQLPEQALIEQTSGDGHTVPHAPQLLTSLLVSTHILLQAAWPVGQPHTPPMHSRSPPQALPQVPQFFGSEVV